MQQLTEFVADKLTVYGPTMDGGFRVSFGLGEYQKKQIQQLMEHIGPQRMYIVVVQSKEIDNKKQTSEQKWEQIKKK